MKNKVIIVISILAIVFLSVGLVSTKIISKNSSNSLTSTNKYACVYNKAGIILRVVVGSKDSKVRKSGIALGQGVRFDAAKPIWIYGVGLFDYTNDYGRFQIKPGQVLKVTGVAASPTIKVDSNMVCKDKYHLIQ